MMPPLQQQVHVVASSCIQLANLVHLSAHHVRFKTNKKKTHDFIYLYLFIIHKIKLATKYSIDV